MGKTTGFLQYKQQKAFKRPIEERINDFKMVEAPLPEEKVREQAKRCMDCGVPFCHSIGCPLHNRVPDFNDKVFRGLWQQALEILHSTNNFPEITGRICPALCEASCTLALEEIAVTTRQIEWQITEKGWAEGWIKPQKPEIQSGFAVAVLGSGPAGLAAAQQLARAGHKVTVFEKDDRIGGFLRYGIPDFKLEKSVLDRRIEQMKEEGVRFETEVEVGTDISTRYLERNFNAVLITTGTRKPRNLNIPGRDLAGIHYAMEYLEQQNRLVAGDKIGPKTRIDAKGKKVIVIGGGDTGADCVGTAIRQGAVKVTQLEIMPKPSLKRPVGNPWPLWPKTLRTGSSHEEGCERCWSVSTTSFKGDSTVKYVECVPVIWDETGRKFSEDKAKSFALDADLVIIAAGFISDENDPLKEHFELKTDERGRLVMNGFMTSQQGVFVAGDRMNGPSLVVSAIASGREAAAAVHKYLMESK